MSVDHVKLNALRADLLLRPLDAESVRQIRALLDHGVVGGTRGSTIYGALRCLECLGLADYAGANQDEGIAWYRPSEFLDDLVAAGKLREFGAI